MQGMAIWAFNVHRTHVMNRPIRGERSTGDWKILRNRWQRKRRSLRSRCGWLLHWCRRLSLELAFVD